MPLPTLPSGLMRWLVSPAEFEKQNKRARSGAARS
jgi:hypothetical protein